jgi:hypothetical protein
VLIKDNLNCRHIDPADVRIFANESQGGAEAGILGPPPRHYMGK